MSGTAPAATRRSRHNNFDALRLFAAIMVIYGHGYVLSTGTGPGQWGVPFARVGLDIFFSISGYLVTGSWYREPHVRPFLAKRGLRIMPGLIACVLLTAFVLGPLVSVLPLRHYAARAQSWGYLSNLALYLKLYLPGVFAGMRDRGAVNGSLWSLMPEMLCYLTVPLFALMPGRLRPWALGAAAAAFGGLGMAMFLSGGALDPVIYHIDVKYMLVETPFFFVGGALSLIERDPDRFYRTDLALLALTLNYGISSWYGAWNVPVEWFTLPYVVVTFGRLSLPLVRRAGALGDLSYGTYLYAFPVQQLVLLGAPDIAHPIVACTALTLPVAWLSWHLVERPAMARRRRFIALTRVVTRLGSATARAGVRGVRTVPALLRRGVTTPVLPAALALACIAAYAGQLQLGRWQTDEYTVFANQRLWGWHALLTRLSYSPRPLSEGIVFLYGSAVLGFGRGLIVPFLAIVWSSVLLAAVLAARCVLLPSPMRLAAAVGLVGSLFAFILMTNPVTELFFWPMAAAAYLPTVGAATALLFLLSHPVDRRRKLLCGAALLVAATSSEIGAVLAISFAGACAIGGARRRMRRAPQAAWTTLLAEALWWLIPGMCGVIVLAEIAVHRLGINELEASQHALTGHAVASVGAAIRQLAFDFIGGEGSEATVSALAGALATKLLFAIGFVLVWRQADRRGARPGRRQVALAAALATTALFSIAAAYFHYGEFNGLCCERQITTEFWFIDLAVILAVAWACERPRPVRRGGMRPRHWIPSAILAVSLFPILFRLSGLRQDYNALDLAADGHLRTWRSGQRTGSDRMNFYIPPDGGDMLIRGTSQPMGTFRVGSGTPEMVSDVGRFFGKSVVTTCQPWQTRQSLVIDGRFIPACPPRDGPADSVLGAQR